MDDGVCGTGEKWMDSRSTQKGKIRRISKLFHQIERTRDKEMSRMIPWFLLRAPNWVMAVFFEIGDTERVELFGLNGES